MHAYALDEVQRGGERYLDDLAWYLDRAGHDVELVAGTSGASRTVELDGIRQRRLRHRDGRVVRRFGLQPPDSIGPSAYATLLRHRFDVVHGFTESAALAARFAGQRTVFTTLGLRDRGAFDGKRRDWVAFRTAVRLAHATTAVSQAAANRVTDLTGRPAVALPAGVRRDRFPIEPAPRTGPPRLLFASDRSERRKGLRVLLAAMDRVLDRHPDARLVLAAPGPDPRAVDDLGPDVALPELYRAASVTVLPSSHEALGLVLVESLASGTPVVACPGGGPAEVVSTPDVGRLAPFGDAGALAFALLETIELAGRPGTAERCAAHAERWDWTTRVGPEHEALYEQVVAGTVGSAARWTASPS